MLKRKDKAPITRANDKKKKQIHKHHHLLRILTGLGIVAVFTVIYPERIPFQYTDFKEGDISQKEIIAPFDFQILMTPEELKDKREGARDNVIPVFDFNQKMTAQSISQVNTFFESLKKIYAGRMSDSLFLATTRAWPASISDKTIDIIRKDSRKRISRKDLVKANRAIRKSLKEFYTIGIINDRSFFKEYAGRPVYLQSDSTTKIKATLAELIDYSEGKNRVLVALRALYPQKSRMVDAWIDIFTAFFRPNVRFNKKETARVEAAAAAAVPVTKGKIYKNEKILDAHKRVTQDDVNVLRSLAAARKEKEIRQNIWATLYHYSGRVLSAAILVALLGLYLAVYRPRFYESFQLTLLMGLVVTLIIGSAAAVTGADLPKYIIPIALGSMLITILYDLETGFVATVVLALFIGIIEGFDYKITLVSFLAGATGMISVMKVRHRSEFYRSMLVIPIAYIVSILTIGLLSFMPFKEILRDCAFGIGNGILSTILTIGILPICESLFKKSTDITLLELSDLNRPLLKQVALDAPGTYHHSIVVGNLAEAGAEKVNANSLLARVGSYYHDIGKLNNPEYFVENQKDFPQNKHDNLSPSMSGLILTAHTKNGVELAKKHGLPMQIRDIIQQHHGTSLMSYFYQRAVDNKADGQDISEQDFRYPGPRPQTKEAGIVMLADAVEAASRTLKDPTTTRLKGMVNDIIESKFRDGQLDECELTFKDLNAIKAAFLPVLAGIFHNRIDYPDQKERDKKSGNGKKKNGAPAA